MCVEFVCVSVQITFLIPDSETIIVETDPESYEKLKKIQRDVYDGVLVFKICRGSRFCFWGPILII